MNPSEQDLLTRPCSACGKRYNVKFAVCPFCGARGTPAPVALPDFAAIAESAIATSAPFVALTWHPATVVTLDFFFDMNWGSDGVAPNDESWRPSATQQSVLTSMGAFLGELIRREMGGAWQADPQHPDQALRTQLALPGGVQVYPFGQTWKRMQCGASQSFDTFYTEVRRAVGVSAAPDEARGWMDQARYFERIGRVDLATVFCDRASAFGIDAAMLADILRIRAVARAAADPEPTHGSANGLSERQEQPPTQAAPPMAPPPTPQPLPASGPDIPLDEGGRALLAQAQALLRQSDPVATLAAFEQLLEIEPAVKEGLLGRARALMALQRLEEASIWLDSFAMRSDCEPDRSLLAAMVADRLGDVRQAHDLLVRIAENPKVAAVSREKAAGRAKALALHPSQLARAIEQIEDLQEVAGAYSSLCKQHPDYAEGWRDFGVALSMLGRNEEALPCFDRAALLEPGEPKSYDHKAVTLARLGRLEAAIATLDQGLHHCPGAIGMTLRKGVLLGNAGHHAHALALFDAVVRDDPAHPDVWANQADIELREGRSADAIQSIVRFLHNNPARTGPRMQAARTKLWSLRNPSATRDAEQAQALSDKAGATIALFGDAASALVDLDAAVRADPLHGNGWFNRASCLMKIGRVADAVASCEQAESLLGATAEVTDLQVAALLRLGRVDDALRCHDRNLAYGKPSADRLHAKVITCMGTARFADALSILQGLIAQQPFDSAMRRERAEALAGLQRYTQALAAYDTAIALAPGDEALRTARAVLSGKLPPQMHTN